ncbi:MAG: hypothetical protein KGJ13_01100 [Patescibacteria group bacterium]|nr:hypothetical protein [Patescibacteria group bacterium]
MKLRTLIIIIILVLIVASIGFYFLLHGNGAPNSTGTGQTGSLPSVGNQQIQNQGANNNAQGVNNASSSQFGLISNEPILDYFTDSQNRITVIEPDGIIKTIANNQPTIISTTTFTNIAAASFSYDGKKILINVSGGTTWQTNIFDLAKLTWTKLPAGIQSPAWAPRSYQIAYLRSNPAAGTESVETLNAGVKSPSPVLLTTIPAEDLTLQWVNRSMLALADRPSAYTEGSIWIFDIQNQKLTPLAYESLGTESIWNTATGTMGLIFTGTSQNAGGNLTLLANGSQDNLTFGTLPSKCAFDAAAGSSTLLFCAVPRDQQTFQLARLPDEYDQKVYFTADDFYKINTTDGALSIIFSNPNQTLDATNVKIFNNTLFFVNRYDQKLYAISLQ